MIQNKDFTHHLRGGIEVVIEDKEDLHPAFPFVRLSVTEETSTLRA